MKTTTKAVIGAGFLIGIAGAWYVLKRDEPQLPRPPMEIYVG